MSVPTTPNCKETTMGAEAAHDSAEFRRELDDMVGHPTSSQPAVAPDEVNQAMIRHWVDALSDTNPVYTDEEFAQQSRFGGIVAPPTMLQIWTMGRPVIDGILERGGRPPVTDDRPPSPLDRAGFTGTVATNSELEFDRYLRPGERLTSQGVIEEISDEKTTGLGVGHFLTWVTTYRTLDGEEVGRQRFRVFKFRPGTGKVGR
jgi:acyl dehydratase